MSLLHLFLRAGVLLGLLSLTAACNAADKPRIPMNDNNDPMITHHIGRFMIQVPQSMKIEHSSASMRTCEIEELQWPSSANHDSARQTLWKTRVQEIERKTPPPSEKKAITEIRPLSSEDRWTQAVSYFGDSMTNRRIFWDVLLDAGTVALLITADGRTELKERILLEEPLDIAHAYHPIYPATLLPKEGVFYLEHGYIALSYASQERTYTRFEGHPFGLKLEIETNETHEDEPPDEGLLGRLAAVLVTGFAAGVDIEKIRTGKREVGGLKGEETILRAKTKEKTDLSFLWRYAGKKDSGDHPKMVIEIEANDGQLDEKLKLWDALLNSVKPIPQ